MRVSRCSNASSPFLKSICKRSRRPSRTKRTWRSTKPKCVQRLIHFSIRSKKESSKDVTPSKKTTSALSNARNEDWKIDKSSFRERRVTYKLTLRNSSTLWSILTKKWILWPTGLTLTTTGKSLSNWKPRWKNQRISSQCLNINYLRFSRCNQKLNRLTV